MFIYFYLQVYKNNAPKGYYEYSFKLVIVLKVIEGEETEAKEKGRTLS